MAWFHGFMILAFAYIGYHFGAAIALGDLWPYIEGLRTTTAIVFGIMGALLAVVFPDVLKHGLSGGLTSGETNLRRVLIPCASAAILLITLILLGPVFAWLKGYSATLNKDGIEVMQRCLFAIFCVLSYWQVIILQAVLFPMDTLLVNTSVANAQARLRRAIHTNGRG